MCFARDVRNKLPQIALVKSNTKVFHRFGSRTLAGCRIYTDIEEVDRTHKLPCPHQNSRIKTVLGRESVLA